MTEAVFSQRVNALSNMLSQMTFDPAERFGIASAVMEAYRYDFHKNLVNVSHESVTQEPKNDSANPSA